LYRDLVKKGGIIAFHDSVCVLENLNFGVNRFITELENGLFDGKKHTLYHIVYSKAVGISYEIKE